MPENEENPTETETPQGDQVDEQGTSDETDAPDAQSDEGAVRDWEAEAKKWEQRAKSANSAEIKKLRAQIAELRPKALERDQAVEQEKTETQRLAEERDHLKAHTDGLRKRLVTETIKSEAAASFADPSDPVGFLDPDALLDDSLEPDADAIRNALADLLEAKPHLAKADPKPRPPSANRAQGSSGNPTPSLDSQIVEARKAGKHELAIHLEMQKLGLTTIK